MIVQHQAEKLLARRNHLARSAFTLMEILVVVAIIVALAGIGGFFLLGQLQDSQADVAKLKAKELQKSYKAFFIKHKRWPQQPQELLQSPDGGAPVLEDEKALYDPWGQPYQFEANNLGMPIVYTIYNGRKITSND